MTGRAEIFLTRLFSKNSEMYARDVYRMALEDERLTDGVIKMLSDAIEQHEEAGRLKNVFDALGGEYDYNILRCVKASLVR